MYLLIGQGVDEKDDDMEMQSQQEKPLKKPEEQRETASVPVKVKRTKREKKRVYKNLAKAWTSETAPRLRGRPKGSKSVTEQLNALQGKSEKEHIKAMNHPCLEIAMAARLKMVAAGKISTTAAGLNQKDVLDALKELIDRTEGKAIQRQSIEHTVREERPVVLDEARWDAMVEQAKENQAMGIDQPQVLPSPVNEEMPSPDMPYDYDDE